MPMDFFEHKPDTIVLISKRIKNYIEIPDNYTFTVSVQSDIKKEIDRLIKNNSDRALLAVIFLHYEEYNELSKLLSLLPFTDITYQIVLFGVEENIHSLDFEHLKDISEFRVSPLTRLEFDFVVRKTFSLLNEIYMNWVMQENYLAKLLDTKQDQDDLINIGRSLSLEKDPEKLLRMILFLSKRITGADAGSIYLVECDAEGKKQLRFKYSHTFSREIPLEEYVIPMDKKSISGYVAVTGEVLNIPNAYDLPEDTPYSYNSSFDEEYKYRCISMLVVPMINHVDEVIGVIQLINSKEDLHTVQKGENEAFAIKLITPGDFEKYVVTFNKKYDSLLEAVAGQAAIAIENNRMILQIQQQFEEFVKASVTAIESRDPATSGHSFRVAEICKNMVHAINSVNDGYLKDFHFNENEIREIELAALLHDFGKVYIDLSVFKKAKKLYPKDFDNLCLRLSYLYRFIELQYSSKEAALLRSMSKESSSDFFGSLINERNEKLNRIKEIKAKLQEMNEPTVTEENPEAVLERISGEIDEIECINVDGDRIDIISELDMLNLAIKRGSLNPLERREIESHVLHTYSFVSKIPWPPEYRNIPEIALRHHEKINGTGYPDGLKGRESTLIQSRIMAIADVYDALSASDRPYKKAVPLDKVLVILREEAERGVLDPDLVELFIHDKIYEKIKIDPTPVKITETAC